MVRPSWPSNRDPNYVAETALVIVDAQDTLDDHETRIVAVEGGGGGLANVVEDSTPQLGGDLDLNGHNITAGSATISPTELGYLDSVTSAIQTQIDSKQASDADLIAIAALTPTNDDFIQRKSGVWVNRSMAQLKTDLALVKGDVGLGNVDNTSDATQNAASVTLTNKTLTAPVLSGTVAGTYTLGGTPTFPSTVVLTTGAQTLASKTLTTPTISSTGFTNAQHAHAGATSGGQITDAALSAAVGIAKGGTGQVTAAAAINALLPSQTSNAGKVLQTDATNVSWVTGAADITPGWTTGRWYSVQQQYAMDWGANTGVCVANNSYVCPIWVPKGGAAIDRINVSVTTGVAASTIRLMAHTPLANGLPGALLFDWGTVSSATSGDKEITIAATLPAGLVLLTCIVSAAVTLGAFESYRSAIFGNTNTGGTDGGPYRANGSMTAPNPWGTTGISYFDSRLPRLAVRAA